MSRELTGHHPSQLSKLFSPNSTVQKEEFIHQNQSSAIDGRKEEEMHNKILVTLALTVLFAKRQIMRQEAVVLDAPNAESLIIHKGNVGIKIRENEGTRQISPKK